jgi:outer membrane protein assembly factor BamE
MPMRRIFLLPLLLLTACGEMPKLEAPLLGVEDYFSSYHLDVRQGNLVSQEMVSQLKVGQTREQVRFVMGTPLLTDPFHDSRWDYVYRYDNGKGDVQQRRLSIYFDNNTLARVAGDVAPVDPNAASTVEAPKPREIEIAPAATAGVEKPAEKPAPVPAAK